MTRPPSIVSFERRYILALAVSLLGWALSYGDMQRQLASNPGTAGVAWVLPVAVGLWMTVWLGLSWLVAHRASSAAKWAVVVLAGVGVVRLLLNIPALIAGLVPATAIIQWLATLVLVIAAAAALFRPDARAWFGEDDVVETTA